MLSKTYFKTSFIYTCKIITKLEYSSITSRLETYNNELSIGNLWKPKYKLKFKCSSIISTSIDASNRCKIKSIANESTNECSI